MSTAGYPPARASAGAALLGEIRGTRLRQLDLSAWAGRVAVLLLSGFHAWLFWSHVADGRLLDPAVAARWFAGVLLTVGFVVLRRFGLPLIRGRKAIVLWLLVALLHAHAVLAPAGRLTDRGALDTTVAAIVLEAVSATVLAGAGLLLLAAALRSRSRARTVRASAWFALHAAHGARVADGWRLVLAPRPPPLAC
jgi:hypothetical protein